MSDLYESLDAELKRLSATDGQFGMLLRTTPYELPSCHFEQLHLRHHAIRNFQRAAIGLFFRSLEEEIPSVWAQRLLSGVPVELGRNFHLSLPEHLRHPPVFFRTDEVGPGAITEIQCPGSAWGNFCLLESHFKRKSTVCANSGPFEQRWTDALNLVFPEPKVIHHLTDNASLPHCNTYFINRTRAADGAPKYWPFDHGTRPTTCNFIRTHLFFGMMYENFARTRLEQARAKELSYDYPPMAIFEQKLLYALPFEPDTRDSFPDEVRALFPHTSVMTDRGFWGEDGSFIEYDEFCRRPPSERNYFIKYGGIDPSMNWGSRAVFYTGRSYSRPRLRQLIHSTIKPDFERGRCWVIQKSVGAKEACEFHSRAGAVEGCEAYSKFSAFYGPTGLLGINAYQRATRKVHGATDTIASVCVPALA